MKLYCKISCEPNKTFDILPDATFSYCANEELDSANIILTHLFEPINDLKPYNWCQIYDENNNKVGNRFLIDSFQCKEINIKEHIYQYTIALMSETKLLEKVQLPNRQWLAKINGSKRKLYDAIDQLMRIYSPKVKVVSGNVFEYDYLIKWDYPVLQEKFNVDLKDLSLSQPTLRQALTAMMIQVGCLPTVENGVLNWLDLRQDLSNFNVNNTMNYFESSMASDSYVNSLDNQGSNIIDTGNECINEILHFTDKENVLLKQKENLFLETSKPIYYVNKLIYNAFLKSTITFNTLNNSINIGSGNISVSSTYSSGSYNIVINNTTGTTQNIEYKIVIHGSNSLTIFDAVSLSLSTSGFSTYMTSTSGAVSVLVKTSAGWISSSPNFNGLIMLFSRDMTKLCVEESKRNCLETDFVKMSEEIPTGEENFNLDILARYKYGTVGYRKGDNKISGFSESFELTNGFYKQDKTYIENIFVTLYKNPDKETRDRLNEIFFNGESVLTSSSDYSFYEGSVQIINAYSDSSTFASSWFEISYQPINDLNIKHEKEDDDIPFRIEQLDNVQNALENLDDLALSENDKVNRLGQEIMSINQLTLDESDIQPIPSKFRDYTVFKKVVSYGLNSISVNYFASKNYIIQNYFTAIATKYRAYAYSGLDQAVIRKENQTVYALLSKNYKYNGSNSVVFGNLANPKKYHIDLLSQFDLNNKNKLSYGYEHNWFIYANNDRIDRTGAFKSEMSIVTFKKNIALNFQQYDNTSFGIAIVNNNRYNSEKIQALGGLPQGWFLNAGAEDFTTTVGFTSSTENWYGGIHPSENDAKSYLEKIQNSPYLTPFKNIPYEDVDTLITIYDTNNYKKYYFKDQSEIINQTLQITYYSDDVKLGDRFTDAICWKRNENNMIKIDNNYYTIMVSHTTHPFSNEARDYDEEEETFINLSEVITVGHDDNNVYIDVNFRKGDIDGLKSTVRVSLVDNYNDKVIDIAEFTGGRLLTTRYYLTLNDTKTNKVYDMSGDIPYLTYEVETGNNTSNLIKHI